MDWRDCVSFLVLESAKAQLCIIVRSWRTTRSYERCVLYVAGPTNTASLRLACNFRFVTSSRAATKPKGKNDA